MYKEGVTWKVNCFDPRLRRVDLVEPCGIAANSFVDERLEGKDDEDDLLIIE